MHAFPEPNEKTSLLKSKSFSSGAGAHGYGDSPVEAYSGERPYEDKDDFPKGLTPVIGSLQRAASNLGSLVSIPSLVLTPALTKRSSIFVSGEPPLKLGGQGSISGLSLSTLGLESQPREHDATKMTTMQAAFNVFNIYVGMTLLSVGYASVKAGLSAYGLCIFIMLVGNWSGLLLVRCFAKLSNYQGESAYCILGQQACGKWGLRSVAAAIMLEFYGLAVTYFNALWQHIAILAPSVSISYIIGTTSVLLLPTVWLLDMSQLSFLSILGTVSSVATVIITILVLFWSWTSDYSDYSTKVHQDYTFIYLENYGLASGIFLFALAGHGCLPSVYNNMKNPKEFAPMLKNVFIAMTILYLVVAYTVFSVYGPLAEILMTQNFATWPGGWVVNLCICLLIAKLSCTLSTCVHVFSEIPEEFLNMHSCKTRRIFRTFVYITCVFVAYVTLDRLDLVEAVTGAGCTMCTSIIFPVLFYARLYWNDMAVPTRLFYSTVFILSIILTIWFLYQDFSKID